MTDRTCAWCGKAIRSNARSDSIYCSKEHRQASWRFGVDRGPLAAGRPFRFAYADPPYPGKAHYYPEGREVDHGRLIDFLVREYPDGWALSTSSEALRGVLYRCPPEARVCVWHRAAWPVKSTKPVKCFEPLIVHAGRLLDASVVQDLRDVLVARGRYRAHPGALVGMKPPEFAVWMFRHLGARQGDTLDDLYPGSGAITRAWERFAGPARRVAAGDRDASAADPRLVALDVETSRRAPREDVYASRLEERRKIERDRLGLAS